MHGPAEKRPVRSTGVKGRVKQAAGVVRIPVALDERLTHDAFEHEGELRADLALLARREDVDDAVDRRCRGVGVQGRQRQVARLGDAQRGLDRL